MSRKLLKSNALGILSAIILSFYTISGFYYLISPNTFIGQIFIGLIGVLFLGLPNFIGILSWYDVITNENHEDDQGLTFKASVNKYSLEDKS